MNDDDDDDGMPAQTQTELMQTMMRVEILQDSIGRIVSIMAEGEVLLG